jgi:Family of unknown function (DUF6496)
MPCWHGGPIAFPFDVSGCRAATGRALVPRAKRRYFAANQRTLVSVVLGLGPAAYWAGCTFPEFEMAKRRKYSKSAGKEVEREMRRYKRGKAKSGRGGKVKSRKQAIAIGLSKARKKGKKVPRKKK